MDMLLAVGYGVGFRFIAIMRGLRKVKSEGRKNIQENNNN